MLFLFLALFSSSSIISQIYFLLPFLFSVIHNSSCVDIAFSCTLQQVTVLVSEIVFQVCDG